MTTDRLRTSPLDTEHLDEQTMLPARVRELMTSGYTVGVVDRHLVVNDKPDDDSSGYIVTEIETTVEPTENAETITLFVCHCAHAHHRVCNWDRVGGPEGADPSDNKHVERVLRSEKRARDVDDDQDTLVPDGGRSKCVECGGYLPDEIEEGAGVYCPQCGTGQLLADGGQVLDPETAGERCNVCGGDENLLTVVLTVWVVYRMALAIAQLAYGQWVMSMPPAGEVVDVIRDRVRGVVEGRR